MTPREFSGRVVLITGAAGGLGRALARVFAAAGAHIAALDFDAAGAGARARPEAVAAEVLRAAERGRQLLLPGRTAKLAWWLSRFAPRYYARMMAWRLRAEMEAE
ncbi:MAG: SDR family NAD(P)-dependent oxidoreductase [Burkholderiales bacterium]